MSITQNELAIDQLTRPLHLMIEALELLDDMDAPADVGAHLDLAIHRLRQVIISAAGHAGSKVT